MSKKLFISVILLFVVSTVQAQTAASLLATKRAKAFFAEQLPTRSETSLRLCFENEAASVFLGKADNFVIVSNQENMPAILGYGQTKAEDMPVQLREWLEVLETTGEEAEYKSYRTAPKHAVKPLLTTVRHQESPYNSQCPFYTYDDGSVSQVRCDVGCVATALEQVLTFYRRTYTLQQKLTGWTTSNYTIPDVDAGASVDTRLILDNYNETASQESIDAVARLSYWLGIAVKMQWGIGSSGTYTYLAEEPLRDVFGLKYVKYLDSYVYSPSDWVKMIHNELLSGRPIYYSANTQHMGGHAFVVDGIDKDGYVHVNWGYGGNYDGYFDLSYLYTGERPFEHTLEGQTDGFYINHEALFIHPDAQTVNYPDAIDRTGSEISVSSYEFMDEPLSNIYTRLKICFKNNSDKALTTPAVLFTTPEGATNVFANADYIGYSSSSIEPGETQERIVHVKFNRNGTRQLCVSPEGVTYQTLGNVTIGSAWQVPVTFGDINVELQDINTAVVSIDVKNENTTLRTGRNVIFEMLPLDGVSDEGIRHPQVLYLQPDSETTLQAIFPQLQYGQTYKVLIRSPWNVVCEKEITIPDKPEEPAVWRNLRGARINKPDYPGVYIKNKEKVLILP